MALDDSFQLYDLRVEVICPPNGKILCGAKAGDHFTLEGEMFRLPEGQGISIYSLCMKSYPLNSDKCLQTTAAVLPLLAAKQRVTHKNDWMTTDALIACPDPNCSSMLKITRTGLRSFSHAATTVVGLDGNAETQTLGGYERCETTTL
jgi:uncharacterized repeat protein (TIGR04076 family)